MANLRLLFQIALALIFGSLVAQTEAKHFENSYLQNVKSGQCLMIEADENGKHLFASKCNCGMYQFWRMEDGEHILNEFAVHPYVDEYGGNNANGAYVGNWDLTGFNWQKWNLNENENDSSKFTLVNKHTSKCLHQGFSGYIDQWECDDNDPAQQWKAIQNPCGKLPKFPTGRFQLQNPETGFCAVILQNSNGAWAPIGTHECSCDNKYHYWKFWNNRREVLVSDGSGQCMANWEADGYPGVTQCTCDQEVRHRWAYVPLDDDGNFQLVTDVCHKCVYVADGRHQDSQVRFVDCDRNDALQKWRFYDACHPPPSPTPPPPLPPPPPPPQPNVIPVYLVYFFDNGQMNWLNPTRYTLLVGGRWDPLSLVWITVDGRQIRPDTDTWAIYFGDVKPSFLNVLFPGGKSWNDVFGWMTPVFFQEWTGWQQVQLPENIHIVISGNIPPETTQLFASGGVNWLTPDRIRMLSGGQWTGSEYVTKTGIHVVPGAPTWTEYFGSTDPAGVNTLFGGSGRWDTSFAWLTDAVRNVPAGVTPGGTFPWDSFFSQMLRQ